MYANRKNLAALFGVTTQTVYRRVKGIEALIGERYNQYAVLDNRWQQSLIQIPMKLHITSAPDRNIRHGRERSIRTRIWRVYVD